MKNIYLIDIVLNAMIAVAVITVLVFAFSGGEG